MEFKFFLRSVENTKVEDNSELIPTLIHQTAVAWVMETTRVDAANVQLECKIVLVT